jgi:hypothetical protein
MNIHLIDDEKFLDTFIERFDEYHSDNLYLVITKQNDQKLNHIKKNAKKVTKINIETFEWEKFFNKIGPDDKLIIHFLKGPKVYFAYKLLNKISIPVYWVFYGAELYKNLSDRNLYDLYDYGFQTKKTQRLKLKLKFYTKLFFKNDYFNYVLKNINFFCFWNEYDYDLAKKHLNGNFKFHFFRYFMFDISEISQRKETQKELNVLLNNSASITGNHLTVLKDLNEKNIINSLDKLVVPLSYGSVTHGQVVLEEGSLIARDVFYPILDFLPKQKYFNLIRSCKIAIFAHRRQEAGNNIFFMLGIGAKVFLRKENNIYSYLTDKGYKVFDYDQINSIEDFEELSKAEKLINYNLLLEEFSESQILKAYKEFFR